MTSTNWTPDTQNQSNWSDVDNTYYTYINSAIPVGLLLSLTNSIQTISAGHFSDSSISGKNWTNGSINSQNWS